MAKEILCYFPIYSCTAADMIRQLDEAKDEEVTLRINANGGDPEYGWGMIAKLKEHEPGYRVKVDGKAHSMYAFMLCYSKNNEALDVSNFIIHRAAYNAWIESDEDLFSNSLREELVRINKHLRAALEAKIDVKKFEKMKGVTLDEIFSLDQRIDVQLDAQEALKVGLINSIVDLSPEKSAEIEQSIRIAAQAHPELKIEHPKPKVQQPQIKHTAMTIEQLRAEQPALYAQVLAAGVAQERTRVNAFLTFSDVDAKAVKEDIEKGTEMDMSIMAAYNKKMMSASHVAALQGGNPPAIQTPGVPDAKTPEQAQVAAEWEKFDKQFNLK